MFLLTVYPHECSILPIFTSRFETAPIFLWVRVLRTEYNEIVSVYLSILNLLIYNR